MEQEIRSAVHDFVEADASEGSDIIRDCCSIVINFNIAVGLDSLFEKVLVDEELCVLALLCGGRCGQFPVGSQGRVTLVNEAIHTYWIGNEAKHAPPKRS